MTEEFSHVTEGISHAAALTERALDDCFREYLSAGYGDVLIESMRYSVFSGGKRIRPYLTLAVCRMLGGDEAKAVPFACAVELIHCYSLIHDDLPAMDNDDFRRGKPSNHKKYGQATAILAGDALQSLAFRVAAGNTSVSDGVSLRAVGILADYAGQRGMAGGQMLDICSSIGALSSDELVRIDSGKTCALFRACADMGAIAAGADDSAISCVSEYAYDCALAFQIIDDINDRDKNENVSFLRVMDEAEAYALAKHYISRAKEAISEFQDHKELADLADYIISSRK